MSLKEIVKKIVEYKNIRFINDRMFVAENGFLKFNSKVNNISTEPKNKFVVNNDEVKFLGACEVLEINIEGNLDNIIDHSKNLFAHLEVKSLENIDNIKIIDSIPAVENINSNLIEENKSEVKKEYLTILDTNAIDLYKLNINNYKRGISVIKNAQNTNIVMGPRTSTFINLNSILPNTEYLFSVDGERLRGNGKFKIGFSQNNLKEIILNERTANFKFVIKTENEKNDSVLLLRPENSLGSINIKRIVISENNINNKLEINLNKNSKNPINNIIDNNIKQQDKLEIKSNDVPKLQNYLKIDNTNKLFSQVFTTSKKHSILLKEKFVPNLTFDLNFTVAPVTSSSKKWINKILPFFPNAKIYNKIINFKDIDKSDKIDLSICSIEDIIFSENIFLEEWSGEIKNLEIINLLNKSKKIFTNSVLNELELKNKLKDPEILRSSKIWPALSFSKNINSDQKYILYFEKDESVTKNLIEYFNKNLNNFIVIGSKLKLPDNIKQYSEYENYEVIHSLLYNSNCVLDISTNNNYKSAILDLIKNYNIPIITNNYHYINYDNAFILKDYNIDAIENFFSKNTINEFKVIKNNDLNYNLEIKNIFCKMLGV